MTKRSLALGGLAAAALAASAHADGNVPLERGQRPPSVLTVDYEYPPPSPVFTGFFCRLDLDDVGFTGTVLDTDDSVKYCNFNEDGVIRIECDAPFPGYDGEGGFLGNSPCEINTTPCGVPGLVTTTGTLEVIFGEEGPPLAHLTCEHVPEGEGPAAPD